MAENINEGSYEDQALKVEAEETETLKLLLKKQEKQLFYSRLAGLSLVVMAGILLVVCIIIVPKAIITLENVNALVEETGITVDNLQDTMANADAMISEITSAAGGINTLVDDNSEVLSESVAKMNAIDFDGLNQAIEDLQSVVEPMANFMNKFR